MRGGEKVVEALCRLLPDADIFTLFYDPTRVSPFLRSRRIIVSALNPLRRYHRALLPFMPMALESFDLSSYDLVISSESGPAKGVITTSRTRHICYCHTPMRYLWDLYPQYLREWSGHALSSVALAFFAQRLRLWDYATAARVDHFVANSANVQRRIRKTYRRAADIVYPPVAVENFGYEAAEDYYLAVAELVAYKRLDLAVSVCTKTGRRLRVVGDGPEYRRLRKLAGPTVEFCGRVEDAELRKLFSRCRALLMPGEEDFGIAAVEALASGKPLVALRRGGAIEIAPTENPCAAVFFDRPESEALEDALRRFEECESSFEPVRLRTLAERFSEPEFARKMQAIITANCEADGQ